MKYLMLAKKWLLRGLVVFAIIWLFVFNWTFVFKKKVVGEVVAAEKVIVPLAVVTNNGQDPVNPQVFSFSIGIKDRHSGEIFVASSEDRQWAAVNLGNCVIAAYFPYPPWMLSKGNTYQNARLLRNFTDCSQMPEQGVWENLKFFFLWH
ncbi:hypothetical protein [Pseudobdellovibrio exovorus]|uniref:Uncharacterized protein n=1 Tax=Pseudobdellovibrio exovorus JSS TaxID=1184267 RepID=M4VR06_9BACT|nr:hypothetical protein [Pseudobdellovibrio exovorus]AGH95599.1 hypothetical protein A11Q_1383 [Pseudobdellovibrio exovorus JSS]